MAKVEVFQIGSGEFKNKFRVQVTHKEPFEDLYEVAHHIAHFVDRRDAENLAERVREKIKEIGLSKAPMNALSEGYWNYTSSAYRNLQEMANKSFKEYVVEKRRERNKRYIVGERK